MPATMKSFAVSIAPIVSMPARYGSLEAGSRPAITGDTKYGPNLGAHGASVLRTPGAERQPSLAVYLAAQRVRAQIKTRCLQVLPDRTCPEKKIGCPKLPRCKPCPHAARARGPMLNIRAQPCRSLGDV